MGTLMSTPASPPRDTSTSTPNSSSSSAAVVTPQKKKRRDDEEDPNERPAKRQATSTETTTTARGRVTLNRVQTKYLIELKERKGDSTAGTLLKVLYDLGPGKEISKKDWIAKTQAITKEVLEPQIAILDNPGFGKWSANKTLLKKGLIGRRDSKQAFFWLTEAGTTFTEKLYNIGQETKKQVNSRETKATPEPKVFPISSYFKKK